MKKLDKQHYATDSGDVSVSFDRSFKNKSGGGKEARYEHRPGAKTCVNIEAVTSSGDILIAD